MRNAIFLLMLCVLAMLVLAQQASSHRPLVPQLRMQTATPPQEMPGGDTTRMWRRAQIRVVPIEMLRSDKRELAALEQRVTQAEAEVTRLALADPAVREHLYRQIDLMRELLKFAQRRDSDQGKSAAAIEVQRHLNEIEGRVMCEACHTQIIAQR
ncbi:MAG TPA: hypothetical protein VGF08_07665 [Terriglobales bacterium]|jgi:hypothetical protein